MKKTIAFVLMLLLLGMTFPVPEAVDPAVGVASREDLIRIAENPGGSYVLTADVDLGGEAWTPIPFSGTFDGAGHTIGNLTVTAPGADLAVTYDGNRKQYETVCAGLFSAATGAAIRDLNLLNVKIDVDTDRHCFIGAVAGYAKETTVSNCTVTARETLKLTSVNAGVGGVIGFSEDCTVENCSVEAELQFIDTNRDVLCEEFLGGVFACGYGTVSECSVYLRGYADIYGYAHNGGVIGMFKIPRDIKKKNFSVHDSTVDVEIRFFEVTPSKRAYCKAIIGEDNKKACNLVRNKELHFKHEYSRTPDPKRPEACADPDYAAVVTEPTCSSWGYTTYTCTHCGYSYRDDYTLPAHAYTAQTFPATCLAEGRTVYTCRYCGDTYEETLPIADHTPGSWTVAKPAAPGEDGEEELRCAVCGALLETRAIPAPEPVPVGRILIDDTVLELHIGETFALDITVEPFNAANNEVLFESDDPNVASVDGAGYISAIGVGTAKITVTSADGNASASRIVIVTAADEPQQEEKEPFFLFSWLRCG